MSELHRWERIKDAVKERILAKAELLRGYIRVDDGRIAFTTTLTDEEKLERFLDFEERQRIIERIKADPEMPPEKVKEYIDRMEALAMKENAR